MKKVVFILGTRPEAIKLAPVIKTFKASSLYETVVVSTGQHREMLAQVFDFFEIEPDFDLDLMESNQSLTDLTAKAIQGVGTLLDELTPDVVVVQGDTTTAYAAGFAGFIKRVHVAHVEAGLRSGRMDSPFPEEANRVLLSQIATWHFAPTDGSAQNLINEGFDSNVHTVGNTVVDALIMGLDMIKQRGEEAYYEKFKMLDFDKDTVLITIHRRESFGEPLLDICSAILEIASQHKDKNFVYPVHPNPNVREVVNTQLGSCDNIILLEPLAYSDFIWMMSKSCLILTDSGGVQEEAPTLGVPVIVAREVTERGEGVDAGVAVMVGSDRDLIIKEANRLLALTESERSRILNPYGDGQTSSKIHDIIAEGI